MAISLEIYICDKFSKVNIAQWASDAARCSWDEPGEWLLLQPSNLLGLSENTKNKNFQLALFEEIQFLCFLKLKISKKGQ